MQTQVKNGEKYNFDCAMVVDARIEHFIKTSQNTCQTYNQSMQFDASL